MDIEQITMENATKIARNKQKDTLIKDHTMDPSI